MEKGIFTRFAIIGLMICGMIFVTSSQATAQGVQNLTVSNITETSATFEAMFQTQTADGFCWGTSLNPTKDDCLGFTEDLSKTGLFNYQGSASGLSQGTTYYVAGYGTISGSSVYSDSVSFTTEGTGGNAAPTDIALNSTSVEEGKSSGTTVGTFTTTDADSGDTHTYSLADGEGGYDNNAFAIADDTLETAAVFDYDVKSSYLIFVQTDDGNGGTFQKEFTITVIKSAPSVTFDPADGATGLAVDTDITITFSEAVRFTDDSEVTSSNADALITLKKDNSAGPDVAFDASINAGKTMITIVPDANLDGGQTYYAAIEADLEGEADNAISATSASFTTLSANAPTATFSPADGATDVAVDASITIEFSEAVRLLDDSEITDANADGLITLKKGSAVGTNVAFDATVNAGKTMITITPDADFDKEQAYYVAIGANVENDSDAAIAAGSATFTTVSASAPPTVTFSPADGAGNVAVDANITITFDKPVRLIDDSTLTDSNADGLITLKKDNLIGANVSFDATVNAGKTVITISPTDNFDNQQTYYAAIGATVKDADGNVISPTAAAFTTEATAPLSVTFDPADGETGVAVSKLITLTFSQPVRLITGDALTDDNVDNLLTLKKDNVVGANVAFDATINAGKTVMTIDPSDNLEGEQDYYVAIGAVVEDENGNDLSASDANFTTAKAEVLSLSIIPTSQNVVAAGATHVFAIVNMGTGEMNWTAVPNDSWITIVGNASGTGSGAVNVSCAANPDEARTGTVTITAPGAENSPQNIEISQAGTANHPPTDITLSNVAVEEGQSIGTQVGTFSSTDPDTTDVHAYRLAPGSGGEDNSSFSIQGNALLTAAVFIYNEQDTYSILVETDDGNGGVFYKQFAIGIVGGDDPTDISLDSSSVDENQPGDTLVGTLSTTDPNAEDVHIYKLAEGTGDADNDSFKIVGSNLQTRAMFDYEMQHSYSIRVQTDDGHGGTFEKSFSITVSDINDDPTDISLDSSSVAEGLPLGTAVGTFDTTDQDVSDNHSYALVTGTGSSDNDSFYIDGITLKTNAVFDSVIKNSYSIRVRTTDTQDATYERQFTITVSAGPTVTFSPADGDREVATDTSISITFSKSVMMKSGDQLAEITDDNVANLVMLRQEASNGPNVPFTASINIGKTVITIDPEQRLRSRQNYYVAIGGNISDKDGNIAEAANANFETEDVDPPVVTFFPADGASDVTGDTKITITFDEPVRLVSDRDIENSDLPELLTFRNGSSAGPDVLFDATINTGKTMITLIPLSDLGSDQTYYITVAGEIEDRSDNLLDAASAIFSIVAPFTDIYASLTGVHRSSAVWGDYDNDNDLDILLTGYDTEGEVSISKVYQNKDGLFAEQQSLIGVYFGDAAWGDYDKDSDPDILLTGIDTSGTGTAKLYRNDDGTFTDTRADLPGVFHSAVAWGDYDNDGDPDILITGLYDEDGTLVRIARIYRNDGGGNFTDIQAGLTGVSSASVAWGDYDRDGDPDILIAGHGEMKRMSKVYRNDKGSFTDIQAGLPGVSSGSVSWGDYDNDGDPDILLTGSDGTDGISKVYRNDNGSFADAGISLTGITSGSAVWGDYDNDRNLDILLAGDDGSEEIAKLYRNQDGSFNDLDTGMTGVSNGSVMWGDYDYDGDLDVLLTGYDGLNKIAKVYRNNVNNGIVNGLPKIVLLLKTMAGFDTDISSAGIDDVSNDGRKGLEEAIYILGRMPVSAP